jgi:tyrosine-protein phosphatase YwqE
MDNSFHHTGKIFSQVVSKEPLEVIIQTTQQQIRGTFHIRKNERLLDELIQAGSFLPITNAKLIDGDGNCKYQTNFMAVNCELIIWIIPISDMVEA